MKSRALFSNFSETNSSLSSRGTNIISQACLSLLHLYFLEISFDFYFIYTCMYLNVNCYATPLRYVGKILSAPTSTKYWILNVVI